MRKTVFIVLAVFFTTFIFSSISVIKAAENANTQGKKQVVLTADFENDYEGWFPLGGQSVLSIDTRHSKTGKTSLYTSERISAWSGPALTTTNILNPEQTYQFQAAVQNDDKNKGHVIKCSLKCETVSDGDIYVNIASVEAGHGGWANLEGEFTVPANITSSCIYIETEDLDVNFSIDAVKITTFSEISKPEESQEEEPSEYIFDFETGFDGWKQRGMPLVERSSDFSYAGQYSLYTSGRLATWNAPTVNISNMVHPEISYEYTAYVMYNGKQYGNNHVFSLQLQYNHEGQEKYENIADKELQKGNWSKINGEFKLPAGATDIYLYVQTEFKEKEWLTEDDLMNFYIDNISIEDSTIKHHKELIQLVLIIALAVVIFGFGVFLIIFIRNKLQETQNVLDTAAKDTMTGTFNRNSYEEQISYYETHPDQCRNIFVTICDVNFLKHINDNYGHEKGDNAIVRCATVLLNTVGKKGNVYRTGGDEFVCITKSDLTNNINKALETESQNYMGYPFAAAIGTATYNQSEDILPDIKKIVTRSDKEMYKNKQVLKEKMKKFYGID